MKKSFGLVVAAIVAATMLVSCPQPYDMTGSLARKTLTYSSSPDFTQTYVFAKDGESGTFSTKEYTLDYPDAASVGDSSKRAWFQTYGESGTFTYDPDTRELVRNVTRVFDQIPGSATTYSADYKEYALLDYWVAAWGPEMSDVSYVVTEHKIFTQDALLNYYEKNGTSYSNKWSYVDSWKDSGSPRSTTDERVYTYTPSASSLAYSYARDRTTRQNGATTRVRHYRTNTSYAVHAAYELGSTDTDDALENIWKKGKTVTFNVNQESSTIIEYEGDTVPAAPTVDVGTGIGSSGSLGANPLNYYFINNARSDSSVSYTLCNYGDYMTFYAGSASRGLE